MTYVDIVEYMCNNKMILKYFLKFYFQIIRQYSHVASQLSCIKMTSYMFVHGAMSHGIDQSWLTH